MSIGPANLGGQLGGCPIAASDIWRAKILISLGLSFKSHLQLFLLPTVSEVTAMGNTSSQPEPFPEIPDDFGDIGRCAKIL